MYLFCALKFATTNCGHVLYKQSVSMCTDAFMCSIPNFFGHTYDQTLGEFNVFLTSIPKSMNMNNI